jgi:hypothetical protein
MLNLSNVELIIIDCINVQRAVDTLKICTANIKFKNVKLLSHIIIEENFFDSIFINQITSIEQYSDFCLKLNDYTDSDYVLLVQNDGFILNSNLWSNDFFNYDYIGAPWYQTKICGQKVGNGGFSLRSKKFLEFSSKFDTTNGMPEDNFLCLDNYKDAIDFGIKFASPKIASLFAYEYRNQFYTNFDPQKHFGFHGKENVKVAHKYILKKETQSIEI